ncbi:FAD-binding oxidoreductase [Bordetella bronchialis]|uniref:FAD-linked oxidase n=1 Tax=Bordetella bronchialis TaxID=463025 RepID=A0A193FJX6_9BORD|nr:FAD-binding oxidoreductase [Bordetella bronchialis]ANN67409.1 FAD-linked oxidase [Bordetella bronchialis]ANN72500.1 FAD-linked oxidase [Bordetella bronchialis]
MFTLSSTAIDDLKANTRGRVVLPADPDYNEVRKVWNAMIDRRPAAIVRCAGVADIRCAILFAREHGVPLTIRGAGHNIAGSAVCDDGIMMDLSLMRSVHIDPATQRAWVEPGATLADFDHEAQAFGLATPVGINSTTGIAGLTLGGGFGWLSRRFGMTIDNLRSADVAMADGELVHASPGTHEDLFWAIRGGGGNFGAVTLFEFQLHAVGPQIYGGLVVLPIEQAREALQAYREAAKAMPEELTVWAVLRQAPPLPFLPPAVHGRGVAVFAVCYSGPVENGPLVVEPIRQFGTPHGEHLGVMPYTAWQKAFDPLLAPGSRNYWKSHDFGELSDDLFDALLDAASRLPSPQCEIFLGQLGGQAGRVAPDAMAYPNRNARYIVNVHSRWEDASDDAACIGWARDFFDAAAPFSLGSVYVNFMTEEESTRINAAYGANYTRLVAIKSRYDPHNLFRHNQNIRPSA